MVEALTLSIALTHCVNAMERVKLRRVALHRVNIAKVHYHAYSTEEAFH